MKKLLIAGLILVLAVGVVFAQQQRYRNGVQTGTGVSYNSASSQNNGSITVEVTFRSNKITRIEVKEHTDTAAFVNMATRAMIPAMISANSSDVDTVSGATYTAKGLKEAVADAMTKARR